MATELGLAYVTIIPSLKGAQKTIQNELNGINVSSTSKSWGSSIVGNVGGGFSKTASLAKTAFKIIGAAATGGVIAGGISRALKIEQAQYKFDALGMDVDKVMASCNEAVDGTAYGLDAAATVASSLGASGVAAGDEMTQSLKGVAGMAAMSGRSMEDIGLIFGKVAAQGKLQGDELTQFAESGINATAELASHLGVSQQEVREMVKDGVIDFKTFSDAMYASFGTAASGANETFTGALSNVGAAINRLTAKFATPALNGLKDVFNALRPAINAVSAALDPMVETFTKFVEAVSGNVVKGLELFTSTLEETGSIAEAFKAVLSKVWDGIWEGSKAQKMFDMLKIKVGGWIAALKAGISPIELIKVELGKLAGKGSNLFSNLANTLKTMFDGTPIEMMVIKIEGWVAALKAGVSPISLLQVEFGKLADKFMNSGLGEILKAQFEALPQPIKSFFESISVGGASALAGFVAILAKFGGPLTKLVTSIAGFGSKAAGVFSKLGGFSGIIGTIGSKIRVFSSAITFCGGGFKGLIGVLGSFMSPVGLIVGAIAALGAAFVYLMSTNDDFRGSIMALVKQIGGSLAPLIPIIGAALSSIASTVLPLITNLVKMMIPILGQIIQVIFQVIAALAPVVTMILGTLIPIIATIIQVVVEVASAVLAVVLPVISTILGLIQTVMPIIQGIITMVCTNVLGIVNMVWPLVQGIISAVAGVILKVIKAAMPVVQKIFETVCKVIQGVVEAVWPFIQTVIETTMGVIESVISIVMSAIKGDWKGVWEGIKNLASTVWNGIKNIVKAGINAAKGVITSVLDGIKGIWNSAWGGIKSFVSDTWDSVCSAVSSGVDSVIGFVQGLPDKIMGFFSDAGSWLLDAGKNIIDGLLGGIKAAWDGVTEFIGGIGDWIVEHKGPPSYDKIMLVENGQLIMRGLADGLASGMPMVESALAGVTDDLSGFNIQPFDGANPTLRAYSRSELVPDNRGITSEGIAELLERYLPEIAEQKNVVIDGKKLVGATAKDMNKALGKIQRGLA